jgi:DNA-binding IclR family transcriptional regulator
MTETSVKSAVRAFEILELFDRWHRPLSLKEIISELDYPASSGSALLKSLLAIGYVDYDRERRTYMPTMRLAQVGRWAEEQLLGKTDLLAAMTKLHSETGKIIILGTQSDLYAQYLHLIYGDEPLEIRVKPGLRRPLCQSGIGLAILAQKRDAEIEHLRRRINMQASEKLSREMVSNCVGAVRDKGYSFSRHTVTYGAGVIAMAIPKERFGRALAIGVAGSVSNLEYGESDIVSSLRSTVSNLLNAPAH